MGTLGGALTPIIGTRAYLAFSGGINFENWKGELLAWGISSLVSLPYSIVGTLGGYGVGVLTACFSRAKRRRKESLEDKF